MFNWDGTDLWIYVDDAKNAIKLGPCGNDLSKKQDVNQYKTVLLEGSIPFQDQGTGGTAQITTQTCTLTYSESGWKMIALGGFWTSEGSPSVEMDINSGTIKMTVTFNPYGGGTCYYKAWVTCAPTN